MPLAVATAIGLGFIVPGVADYIVSAGRNIPHPDIAEDYLRACFWAVVFGVLVVYLPVPSRDKPALLFLWIVKCGVALGAMLWYERHYAALDAYWYFADATHGTFSDQPVRIGFGTENVSVLADRLARVVGRSFHSLKLAFSLMGLWAVYLFYRAGVRASGRENPRVLIVLGLVPTVLFWSTTFGKEPIALLGIGLYTWGVVSWQRSGRLHYAAAIVAGVVVATLIRLWLGPLLLAPVAWLAFRAERRWYRRALYTSAVLAGLAVAITSFRAYFQLESARDLLETTDRVSRAWAYGGSGQVIGYEFTSFGRILAFLPIGMFTALFRPLPGEVMNPFGLLAGVENVVLLCLLALALYRSRRAHWVDPLVQWGITLVLLWSAIYGIVSYQNLGTAVRFKLQILPLLVGLLLYLAFTQAVDHGTERKT